MNIKKPAGYDISHWETIADFSALDPRPLLVITKATEGLAFVDETFARYMAGIKAAGIHRGCYHFFRNAYSANGQADNFINVTSGVLEPNDIIVLDMEETGTSAAQMAAWIERVKLAYPDNLFMIYSRKNLLDPISMTSTQAEYFREIPVWTAGYPYAPDNYSSPPASYIPDQSKWGRVWMWQYSDAGQVTGCQGAIDLNWLSSALIAHLGEEPPPPQEERVEYFRNKKIEVTHGRADNNGRPFDYHIIKFARADIKRVKTTPGPITRTALTEDFLTANSLHVACNMDEVIPNTLSPKGWGLSGGVWYKYETSETGIWFRDHQPFAMQWNRPNAGETDAACGSNILVQDGAVWQNLDNVSADPRTVLGYDSGHIFIINVDGRLVQGELGVTRYDLARWLLARGIVNAHNLDGGGSSRSALLNDNDQAQVINVPSETRWVINHIGFELKETAPPPPPEEEKMEAFQYREGKRVKTWVESDKPSPLELDVWIGDKPTRLIPKKYANVEGCTPAKFIGVKDVPVTVQQLADIKDIPDSQSITARTIASGASITVKDYYIPDTVGFGANNIKWHPLADGPGFISRADISTVPERTVIDTFYEGSQRRLKFSDNTCLDVPEAFKNYTVPSDGKYKRAAHDWERPDWNFKPRTRTSCPETVPLWDKPDFYELREDWQRLWWRLIKWAAHQSMTGGQLRTAWADITAERKALTDNHGLTHGFTDYILGVHLDNNKPMQQKGLVFGGTMLKIRYGSTIFALDPRNPAPTLGWLLDRPWLWGWCTQINSSAVAYKWPQLKKFGDWSVPYLILGYGEKNTLKAEHLVELSAGQVYSPYTRKA